MASEVKLKMNRLAVLCIWISLIGLTNCEKKPTLVIYPVSTVQRKPVGKSLMLTCKPDVQDYNLVTDLRWRDNKNNTIYSKQGGQPAPPMYTETLANEQSLALFIPKLEETMAGFYYCSASYANTEQMDIGVKIETFVPITWKNAPEEQYPIRGDNYLVKCEVTANPPPAVDWLRSGDPIKTGGRFVVDSRGLMIRDVQLEDDGFYTCRAVVIDTGELQERVIKLGVQIKPQVLTLPQKLEAVEGQAFNFKCNATGKPPPQIEWIKDRTQQNLALADRFVIDGITGQMTILRVTDDDYGTYTCLAKNSAGVAESKTMLNVLVVPKIYELWNITISTNDEGSIKCKATGRPAPIITFKRWGTEEEYSEGYQVDDDRITLENNPNEARGETVGTLTIRKMVRPDDGLYQCIARNKGGEVFRTGHITVEYPPSFDHMRNLPPVYTWEQRRANLSCLAQGFPNATIEWRIGDKLIKDMLDANMVIESQGPRSDLLIRPLGRQYYRAYRCIATNKLGTAEHIMELREARIPDAVPQVRARVVTATTVTFEILSPPFEIGLSILAYHVQYMDDRRVDWTIETMNRTWSVDSPYIVEGLLPERTYKFRFAARNKVGQGNWGAITVQSTPKRSFPEPPVLLHQPEVTPDPGEEPIVASPYSDKFDMRWTKPHDNGERIDYFNVKYCEGEKVNGAWVELDEKCLTQQVNALEGNSLELRDLRPETTYRIELRAHNAIGLSEPSQLLLKTARGESTGSTGTFTYRAGYHTAPNGSEFVAVPKIHSVLLCLLCSSFLFIYHTV